MGSARRRLVLFKSNECRTTAFDLVRKSITLRGRWSPSNIYLNWRHNEIKRLNLGFYQKHSVFNNISGLYRPAANSKC